MGFDSNISMVSLIISAFVLFANYFRMDERLAALEKNRIGVDTAFGILVFAGFTTIAFLAVVLFIVIIVDLWNHNPAQNWFIGIIESVSSFVISVVIIIRVPRTMINPMVVILKHGEGNQSEYFIIWSSLDAGYLATKVEFRDGLVVRDKNRILIDKNWVQYPIGRVIFIKEKMTDELVSGSECNFKSMFEKKWASKW